VCTLGDAVLRVVAREAADDVRLLAGAIPKQFPTSPRCAQAADQAGGDELSARHDLPRRPGTLS
jgi:hypothetical protein